MIKRDANETEIVERLVAIGAIVIRVNNAEHYGTYLRDKNGKPMRAGFPDLIVQFGGEIYFMEVKTTKAMLENSQKAFHPVWNEKLNRRQMIYIVRTPDDALRVLGQIEGETYVYNP